MDELGLIAEEFNVLAEESPVVMTNLQVNSEAFSTANNLQPLAKCRTILMNCEIPEQYWLNSELLGGIRAKARRD